MNVLHLRNRASDGHPEDLRRSQDLESAFNDDFHSSANSVGAAVVRWLVILWTLTTLAVGTFVIIRAALAYAPEVLAGLGQIFS